MNGIEPQQIIMLISVFLGDLKNSLSWEHKSCWIPVYISSWNAVYFISVHFYKVFHLGCKEIPDINIIGNKRKHIHNSCLAGNTWGNGIYAGNQDFKIPNLFMSLNSGIYYFSFMSPIVLEVHKKFGRDNRVFSVRLFSEEQFWLFSLVY